MEKIVIDTNVLIDGARDEHSAAWLIIQAVVDSTLIAFISRQLEREMRLILNRKIEDQAYYRRIEKFLEKARHVDLKSHGRLVPNDHEDDKVLATAIDAGADFLITSDRHLLSLDPYENLRIVTPVQFQNLKQSDNPSAWSNFLKQIGLSP